MGLFDRRGGEPQSDLPLVAAARMEFATTMKQVLSDPEEETPENVRVVLSFGERAVHPAATLCLVGQYLCKMSFNLDSEDIFNRPAWDRLWEELSGSLGAPGGMAEAGPSFLTVTDSLPGKAMQVYSANLYAAPGLWALMTPYSAKGAQSKKYGPAYYGPLSVFALMRFAHHALGEDSGALDELVRLVNERRGELYEPENQPGGIKLIHEIMGDLGVAAPEQLTITLNP